MVFSAFSVYIFCFYFWLFFSRTHIFSAMKFNSLINRPGACVQAQWRKLKLLCLFVCCLAGWLFAQLLGVRVFVLFALFLYKYKFNLVCKWHVHESTKKKHFTIIPERNAPILFSINACRDAQTTWQRHKAATECGLI